MISAISSRTKTEGKGIISHQLRTDLYLKGGDIEDQQRV